jgi:hypothetical protein
MVVNHFVVFPCFVEMAGAIWQSTMARSAIHVTGLPPVVPYLQYSSQWQQQYQIETFSIGSNNSSTVRSDLFLDRTHIDRKLQRCHTTRRSTLKSILWLSPGRSEFEVFMRELRDLIFIESWDCGFVLGNFRYGCKQYRADCLTGEAWPRANLRLQRSTSTVLKWQSVPWRFSQPWVALQGFLD